METASDQAVTCEEFADLMARFGTLSAQSRLALAVSGGPDSMALAWLAQRWAAGEHHEIRAFIVDHRLRPESDAEAKLVQDRLAKLGIASEVLVWEHAAITSKIHVEARRARYRLMGEACHRHHIPTLLLGHQRDDQVETILMRFAKGSGIDGLAGMRADSLKEGVRLLRPFLGISKTRLEATCTAAGLDVIRDPSNDAQKYARGRLRRVMPLLEKEGFTIERLFDLGLRAAEAADALDYQTNLFLRDETQRDEAGAIYVNTKALFQAPQAISLRALNACLLHIHPSAYTLERDSLLALFIKLRAANIVHTLNGCLISNTETRITIIREYAAASEYIPVQLADTTVWDQRWRVTLGTNNKQNFVVKALGNPPHEDLDRIAPGLRKFVEQGRVRATLPALWYDNKLASVPTLRIGQWNSPAHAQLIKKWPL